jgi:hypothetical protein
MTIADEFYDEVRYTVARWERGDIDMETAMMEIQFAIALMKMEITR